jgi:ubiquitin carboxyl-terminal hydrolase 34
VLKKIILQAYTTDRRAGKDHPFYPHTVQIQVRLHFLAMLFSHSISPDQFRLTQEQVSILWECLARDAVSSDDLFQWLLAQAHSKDQHALGIDSVKFIYSEKLPELRPDTMTMTGLNLLSQLSTLVRISETSSLSSSSSDVKNSASTAASMEQLWRIALQATNTDVSMKAIQILNGAYLGRGEEFLSTCMRHLQQAGASLSVSQDQLVRVHRALLLLKSHLETFRRKYAYHFRSVFCIRILYTIF